MQTIIRVEKLAKTFNQHQALHAVDLNIHHGEMVALLGPSGSGKSTTLKMINRLVEHDSGEIRFAGEEIRSLPVLELRRRMGYAIQSIGLFPHWSVAQNIATVPQLQKWSRARIDDRIDELMALLGLESNLRERYPHQLSGGQQQRVAIARALATDPEIIYFDEPTSALDPELTGEVLGVMRQLAKEGMTMLVVTHEMGFARNVSNKVVFMENGVVVEEGPSKEFFANPREERTRTFLQNIEQHYE